MLAERVSKVFQSRERRGLRGGARREVQALKEAHLQIEDGEIFGLLGPNGAGKTTLIKCITTLLIPTAGRISVNGYEVGKQDDMVRASIGCMLMGERGLYWKLTGRENLDYFGALYHVPRDLRRRRTGELISLLNLGDFVDRTVETYSSGQRMLLAFAKALIHDAPILILDEPTVTMDVPTARNLRRIVRELNAQGHTVLYTTHLMHEAEELCHRVAIIDRGQIIALGTPAELKSGLREEDVITIEGIVPPGTVKGLQGLSGVQTATVKGEAKGRSVLTILCDDSRKMLPGIIGLLMERGATIEAIRPEEVTLEDVFIARTGRGLDVDTRERGAA